MDTRIKPDLCRNVVWRNERTREREMEARNRSEMAGIVCTVCSNSDDGVIMAYWTINIGRPSTVKGDEDADTRFKTSNIKWT